MNPHANQAAERLERRARARGLTVIELMTALVVVGVLVAIAVPSYKNAQLSSRLSASANDLFASVQLARSEAIKRNVAVTLCASANGSTCTATGGWEQGWVLRAAGAVIQTQAALPDGYLVTQTGGTAPLNFQPIGIGATSAVFTVCRDDPDGNQERVVTVRAAGGAYVTRTETGSCS